MYWLEWRCQWITVTGTLSNEKKEKLSPQSVLNVKWHWKQRCLQFPAKQLQWWRSPVRRWQAVPDACSHYREGAVAKCDTSRWQHDQCRRCSRPKVPTCIYVSGLAKSLGKIKWCSSTIKAVVHQNTQLKLDPLWNLQPVQFTAEGVLCSDLLAENTRRAAAFITDCSRCNSVPEIPGNTEQQ